MNELNTAIDEEDSKYEFYKSIGSPKYILAPMVDASELAWRLLGRRYGVQLTYTPMYHASMFVNDATYRREAMHLDQQNDRPLIFQFCANDPAMFSQACRLVQQNCDAVDLNLGCPQGIARRGHYGAFLQEEWPLISEIIRRAKSEVDIPITAKIRVFPELEKTLRYAKILEEAGVALLTVHGRTREQKAAATGLADWTQIARVKEALRIPVIANGNIQYFADVERCVAETRVDGVMSAEGHLHNPAIFSEALRNSPPQICAITLEYLDLAAAHPCPLSFSRGHVFKLLHHALALHTEFRERLSTAKSLEQLRNAVLELDAICGPMKCEKPEFGDDAALPCSHWLAQPYVRPQTRTLSGANQSKTSAEIQSENDRKFNIIQYKNNENDDDARGGGDENRDVDRERRRAELTLQRKRRKEEKKLRKKNKTPKFMRKKNAKVCVRNVAQSNRIRELRRRPIKRSPNAHITRAGNDSIHPDNNIT